MDELRRGRLLRAYRGILVRHLVFEQSRNPAGEESRPLYVLSKNPSFTSWVPSLLEAFPDACVIGLRRPLDRSLPSQLSSMRGGFALFGHRVEDARIVERFRRMFLSYWSMLQRYRSQADASRFVLVSYQRLREEPCTTVTHCLQRFGYGRSESDEPRLVAASSSMRAYVSRHRYSLEEFGLTLQDVTPTSVGDIYSSCDHSLEVMRDEHVSEQLFGVESRTDREGDASSRQIGDLAAIERTP